MRIIAVELAKRMKMTYPNINVIFSTGYDQYRGMAFGLHASGYLTKPILPEDVKWELEDLRRPVQMTATKRIRVQAFGNFEVFLAGLPIRFKYERTKEMLAYLVDQAQIDCDYYDWRDGRSQAVNLYRGEYMSQYSWAEFKHSSLQSVK